MEHATTAGAAAAAATDAVAGQETDAATDAATAAATGAATAAATGAVAGGPAATNPCTAGRPPCYVLFALQNKKLNIGMTVRSAVAFGAAEIIVAGSRGVRTHGDMGTMRHTRVRDFDRLRDAVAWLRGRGVAVCGIEITPDAEPVERHPFRGPTAFLAGAEGDGLRPAHKALCDHFVYIPQFSAGTASLNVTVATSIVLHHFAAWARYAEAPRQAGADKFAVAAPPKKTGAVDDIDLARREARRRAREEEEGGEDVAAAAGDAAAAGALLGALALDNGDDYEDDVDGGGGGGEEEDDGEGDDDDGDGSDKDEQKAGKKGDGKREGATFEAAVR